MTTRRCGLVHVFLVFARALLIAVALVLLASYFGWHVREAGGTVVRAAFYVRDHLLTLGVRPGGILVMHTSFSKVAPPSGMRSSASLDTRRRS